MLKIRILDHFFSIPSHFPWHPFQRHKFQVKATPIIAAITNSAEIVHELLKEVGKYEYGGLKQPHF